MTTLICTKPLGLSETLTLNFPLDNLIYNFKIGLMSKYKLSSRLFTFTTVLDKQNNDNDKLVNLLIYKEAKVIQLYFGKKLASIKHYEAVVEGSVNEPTTITMEFEFDSKGFF